MSECWMLEKQEDNRWSTKWTAQLIFSLRLLLKRWISIQNSLAHFSSSFLLAKHYWVVYYWNGPLCSLWTRTFLNQALCHCIFVIWIKRFDLQKHFFKIDRKKDDEIKQRQICFKFLSICDHHNHCEQCDASKSQVRLIIQCWVECCNWIEFSEFISSSANRWETASWDSSEIWSREPFG